jgi:hypothetical protein
LGCDAGPSPSDWDRLTQLVYQQEAASYQGDFATPAYTRRRNVQDDKMPSSQEQSANFEVKLHLVTMPGVVVTAWVKPMNITETSVLMGFTLSELEC